MKERNKGVDQTYSNEIHGMDDYCSSEFTCKKHPSSSSVGICALCLKDRLVKLVCSDCGEQRLSSCSCCSDEISSSRRNSCSVEVGSVGRVSFLIENEKNETFPIQPPQSSSAKAKPSMIEKEEEIMVLRRSSSNCVEIKRRGRFWRIGRLFAKKKSEKDVNCGRSVNGGFDEKSEMWMMMMDHNQNHGGGVSRSRSLCSFRGGGGGGGMFGSEDGGDSLLSGARSSISAARSSGVNVLESGRRSGYSEATEPRRSGFDAMDVDGGGGGFYGVNRRVFSLRESDFRGMDESSFIDLKLDYSSESRPESSAATLSAFGSTRGGGGGGFMAHDGGGGGGGGGGLSNYGGLVGDGVLASGGSCRISVNERGIKRGRKSMKGWRWIFRYNSNPNPNPNRGS